ncbi:unnamed protein product [Pieris brassicae]|uniref:Uncharacterized protein n=1 Tax=Pieris brassicae TaxID=7116 RepID=A0A9P0XJ79_PIEBR|nr:unnamed protein product [Pieris brassicae]
MRNTLTPVRGNALLLTREVSPGMIRGSLPIQGRPVCKCSPALKRGYATDLCNQLQRYVGDLPNENNRFSLMECGPLATRFSDTGWATRVIYYVGTAFHSESLVDLRRLDIGGSKYFWAKTPEIASQIRSSDKDMSTLSTNICVTE